MAEHMRAKLLEDGLGTRDLMDVYDFIRITLTPSARHEMVAQRSRDSVAPAAAKGGEQAA